MSEFDKIFLEKLKKLKNKEKEANKK